MRTTKSIHVISAHAEGEVGDVIVGGVLPPPGKTVWEQSKWLLGNGLLRNFLLNEPRGGVFKHINLLVPPKNPKADAAFIIMEPEFNPPMSGSNSICVATVLLDVGLIKMIEPITTFILEAPGGLVKVKAECSDGKANRIYVENLPSFANALDLTLEIDGYEALNVDTAFGGDSFVVVDAESLGFKLAPDEAKDLAKIGEKITNAANEQLNFYHPTYPDWGHFSFCHFCSPLLKDNNGMNFRSAVAVKPGKIDRSPTGTALSAKMAILHKRGKMKAGETLTATSIIGSQFSGQILGKTKVGSFDAILPQISGRGWITGTHQYMLDPADPWPGGYRISDTWGV